MTKDEIITQIAALCGNEKARRSLFFEKLLDGIKQLEEGIAKAKAAAAEEQHNDQSDGKSAR